MSMLDFVKLKFVILVMTLVIGMMALSASQNYPGTLADLQVHIMSRVFIWKQLYLFKKMCYSNVE